MMTAVSGRGTFLVLPTQWANSEDRCGIEPPLLIRYRARVEGMLDRRGFVIDARDIIAYFSRRYEIHRARILSCERIAVNACMYFRRRGYRVTRVVVEIQPSDIGYATAEWNMIRGGMRR